MAQSSIVFMRKSDFDCMVREWGSPTFFCTFSCAQYESPDIIEYLRKVNNVPDSYDNGRLCTEDPISVSHQFSHKFHQFFNIVINKGGVLGPVEHFYWKNNKEHCITMSSFGYGMLPLLEKMTPKR